MMVSTYEDDTVTANPLDVVEGMVLTRDWSFDRRNDEELSVEVPGRWCDYSLYFAWSGETGSMHFSCAMDMRISKEKRRNVNDLLALINGNMWMGFFGVWPEEGLPLYRQTMPLRGTPGASLEQLDDMVEIAISECERYYPAFQFVIWGGKSPEEAVEAAMIDTVGEA